MLSRKTPASSDRVEVVEGRAMEEQAGKSFSIQVLCGTCVMCQDLSATSICHAATVSFRHAIVQSQTWRCWEGDESDKLNTVHSLLSTLAILMCR